MTDRTAPAPRLYYVHPLWMGPIEDWGAGLDHAAAMGFDSILSAPPFDPGPEGNIFLTFDPNRLHPALGFDGDAADGIARLAEAAQLRGLALMLDLEAGRAAAGDGNGALADAALDPRIDPAERGAVDVALEGEAFSALGNRLKALAARGVAGFRCLSIDRVPVERWRALIEAVRAAAPDVRFMAWTPGLSFERRSALVGAGFDAVFSSLRWWDCRATWLIDEHETQRRIGPEIAFPEAPFAARLAREVDNDEDTRRALGRALWLSATLGDGLLVPMGFEFGAREPLDRTRGTPADFADVRRRAQIDLTEAIAGANAFLRGEGAPFAGDDMRTLAGPSAPVTAVLRADAPNAREAEHSRLVLVNPDLRRPGAVEADHFLSETGGRFTHFVDIAGTLEVTSGSTVRLAPGEVRVLTGTAGQPIVGMGDQPEVDEAERMPRIAMEAMTPCVDGGRHPAKRIVGTAVRVEVDVITDGHDTLAANLLWRTADEDSWREMRMDPIGNDRWAADMPLERIGRHLFTVEAWRDVFETFRADLTKKHTAGLKLSLDLEEGRLLVADTLDQHNGDADVTARVAALLAELEPQNDAARLEILLSDRAATIMRDADPKRFRYRMDPPLQVDAERTAAGFANWYEMFPRSASGDPERHGTFRDVIRQLPRVRAMGFDVLYFPPIHPIGTTNRKGRNNALTAGPGDPGSPYAIGSAEGGHDTVHPQLGTLADFRELVAAAHNQGIEIALDFAIQCSPDHPWLKEHPEWFDWRPDGTIRYAENPPKTYEDIVNVDFYAEGAIPSLWLALRDVVLFWVREGVKLYRVDNPHTKSFPFWEWMIADVRSQYPDVVFLAEAFTRPKVMYRLAKIGFSQSYTYFTWRNTKWELESYLTELNTTDPRDFFRPHFFVNTPDINPPFLHNAPRQAFLIRAALATTLSGLWGLYNGFELCEGRPVPGKEEYLDSEKYEIRAWDWDRPGNIVAEITRLNQIRRDNPALHSHLGVTFLKAANDKVLWFQKATAGRENVLLIAISLDPLAVQTTDAELPLWEWGVSNHGRFDLDDLMRGGRFSLAGKNQRLTLDPADLPFSIWRIAAAWDH